LWFKTQQLILGTGTAIWVVTEPHWFLHGSHLKEKGFYIIAAFQSLPFQIQLLFTKKNCSKRQHSAFVFVEILFGDESCCH